MIAQFALVTDTVLPSGFKVPAEENGLDWVIVGGSIVAMSKQEWEMIREVHSTRRFEMVK